ncbi:MAG: VWA domain-containing protein, partial [Acidobacteriota bacterium]
MNRSGAGTVPILTLLLFLLPSGPYPAETVRAPTHKLPIYVPLQEKVETRLVLVPVTVLDRSRRPVRDLKVSDFQLQVDGRPHRIVTFDPPLSESPSLSLGTQANQGRFPGGSQRPEKDAGAGGEAGDRSSPPASHVLMVHIALVLDLFQTRPQRVTAGIHAVRQALKQGLPARTDAALFVMSQGRPVTAAGFTRDTERLLQALDRIETNPSLRDHWLLGEKSRQDAVRDYIPHEIASTPSSTQGKPFLTVTENRAKGLETPTTPGGNIADNLLHLDMKQSAEAAVRSYSAAQAQRNTHLLEALTSLAAALSRLPGRKSVVLVGDGFREQAGINYALGQDFLMDKTRSLRKEFRRLTRLYERAGVTLSPVSLLGLYHPRPADPDGLDEIMGSMTFLSQATGGRPPAPLNGFSAEIAAAVVQPSFSYVLGFRPLKDQPPGTVHAIHVRVRRPRLTVTARSGYVDLSGPGFQAMTRAAGALLLPEQYQDFPVSLQVHIAPGPASTPEISLQMELPTNSVAWMAAGDRRRRGKLRVQGFLRDATGRVEVLFDDLYPLTVDAWKPPRRIVIQESSRAVIPRASSIVVMVLDGISGRIGTASLSVPPWNDAGTEPQISRPVLLPEATETYLLTPDGEPRRG